MTSTEIRLNKHLALTLGISRREADNLIASGVVTVDGRSAILGSRIAATSDVSVDGRPLAAAPDFRYVLFHKPAGYVCSRKRQGDVPTIYELLPNEMHLLKPVGRLDKDSSGLLLLTNDGDFAHTMTHPSFHKVKTYEVTLAASLEALHQQMISDIGIEIGDGASRLVLEKMTDDRKEWRISMHEGRNRQIRRTFEALGYSVTRLHRTSFGIFTLESLAAGKTKAITI